MIELQALSVSYGRTVAIDNISLKFEVGITGLFGPNGSGKSTLLRTIAGLLRPTSGSIVVDGQNPRTEDARENVGYVGHSPGLYRDLTVRENLDLFGRLYGAAPERTGDLLELFGLGRYARIRAGELSAGLARRAGVARAFAHDPGILLLDEPYANVDDDAAALISRALTEWRGPGRSAIVATHGAKKVKAFADAGVILRDGRIVTAGRYRQPAVQ